LQQKKFEFDDSLAAGLYRKLGDIFVGTANLCKIMFASTQQGFLYMEIEMLGARRGILYTWQADRRRGCLCRRPKGVLLIPAPPARRAMGNKREISGRKRRISMRSNFAHQALFAAAATNGKIILGGYIVNSPPLGFHVCV
jgi:hypothetical protein